MDSAAYALAGTAVGALISGAVGLLTARMQARSRQVELEQQERVAQRSLTSELRREKCQRYAAFLSAFWQEERFVSGMLEQLSAQRPGWSDAIRRINTAPDHLEAIHSLNESLGWLSILCEDVTVEEGALALHAEFDRMIEVFGEALQAARDGTVYDVASVAQNLETVRLAARDLSGKLRADARVIAEHYL